ncbi:hypothetical protein GE09DRAFT_464852 [Coniochaeta sp. 2T2.1]|nr:hypothetical protein GE09DRAFT_464852 [Coniochaeta sp. 2T2.1]
MAAASLLFTPKAVPISSVHIGSLIIDLRYPFQEPHRPSPAPQEPSDYFVAPYKSFRQLQSAFRKDETRAHVSQLAALNFARENNRAAELEALEGRAFELVAPLAWFEAACGRDDTRRWFERVRRVGADVFLVVGFRTLFNPRVKQSETRGSLFSADLTVPLEMIGGVPPGVTGGVLDPGVGATRERRTERAVELELPGEMVYAVHYKRVRFETFKRRVLENSYLDRKNLWIDLSAVRSKSPAHGEAAAADVEVAMLKADLVDNVGVWGEEDGGEGEGEDKFVLPEDMD